MKVIVFVGIKYAGKTTCIKAVQEILAEKQIPIQKKIFSSLPDGTTYSWDVLEFLPKDEKVQIFGTGGDHEKTVMFYRREAIPRANRYIFVIDCQKHAEIYSQVDYIMREISCAFNRRTAPSQIPAVIFYNKVDMFWDESIPEQTINFLQKAGVHPPIKILETYRTVAIRHPDYRHEFYNIWRGIEKICDL